VKVICEACTKLIDAPDIPAPKVFNSPTVSLIAVEHPRSFACPECGATLFHGCTPDNMKISILGCVLPPQLQPSLIVPANGVKLVKH
jgi:hypothetical protein